MAAALLAGCATAPRAPELLLAGETMGSVWTVKVAGATPLSAAELRAGIQARFDVVDLALSTWREDSALSRFNAVDSGEWLDIDAELAEVMAYALELGEQSGGAYDVTIGPLVDLWGFGPVPPTHQRPDAAAIEQARARVGWRRVEVDVAARRARKDPGVRVDLSSLGKGRGVDRVAEYLDGVGVSNYLIDLSGKLRARGVNAAGRPWRIGVERPGPDAGTVAVDLAPDVIELRDESVATAGDYRKFFERDGRHYSHIIDPRTGEPVNHSTVSATALHAGCMEADALATVLMVMEPAGAIALAQRQNLRALLIGREGGGFAVWRSANWPGR